MPEISLDLILVLIAAFGAGVIDSMVGGGGLVQLPALFAFYPSVTPPALLGTSKLAGIFGTASAVWRYATRVTIPWRALVPLPMAACNVAGSIAGTRLALRGGSALVRKVFIAVVSLLIVRTAWVAVAGSG